MRDKRQGEKRGAKKAATKKSTKKEIISVKAKKAPAEKKATKAGSKIEKKKIAKRTAAKETKKVKSKAKKKVTTSPVKKETKTVRAEIKVKKETKANKKIDKKIEKKVEKKKVIKKPAKAVKVKTVKVKKVALPKKAVLKKPVKMLDPVKKEIRPPIPMGIIPEEYGEDAVALMTVDPKKLFIYWEVTEDTLAKHKGDITIRLYDITGIDFDGMNANSYLDLTVDKRIGDLYMDVHPGRDYIADIGVKDLLGIFISIARSNKATTPLEGMAEEGKVLHPRLYETGLPIPPIGYEK